MSGFSEVLSWLIKPMVHGKIENILPIMMPIFAFLQRQMLLIHGIVIIHIIRYQLFPTKRRKIVPSRVHPMAKQRFFVKIMIFPHSTVKRVKKYSFDQFFADLAPTVADEVVLRAA